MGVNIMGVNIIGFSIMGVSIISVSIMIFSIMGVMAIQLVGIIICNNVHVIYFTLHQIFQHCDAFHVVACVQDVRLNGELIPIESGQNTGNSIADHYREQNIFDGCIRPDSCAPLRTCPLNQICIDLWGHRLCR